MERPSSAPSRGALSRRSYVVLVGLVSLAPACTSEAVPTPSDVLDPVRGTVPELQRAEISVLVLPGNGYYALDEGGPDSSGLERIEFAFWATGDVVWSDGSEPGAAPHRHARIAPEQVTSLAAEVEARISSTALREFMVFDTSHEQIRVRTKGSELLLVSCHELFESNPNLVALSYGITPLEGRACEDALAKEPAEFLAFPQYVERREASASRRAPEGRRARRPREAGDARVEVTRRAPARPRLHSDVRGGERSASTAPPHSRIRRFRYLERAPHARRSLADARTPRARNNAFPAPL